MPEAPARALDLGSGGGVPGLILAERWPTTTVVLLDARARRTEFLAAAVEELGWSGRVEVRTGRAEELGRDGGLRHAFELVVARSFGAPAVTAECGAPFLQVSGLLVVAEPPDADRARWPSAGLAALGLADDGVVRSPDATVRRLRAARPCGEAYPRANGVPAQRPLF